jgi:hypothetical protein
MKFIIFFTLLIFGCVNIPYRDDTGTVSAIEANSPEALIKINGKDCKDMDGNVGACMFRTSATNDITFTIEPLPYPYGIVFDFTDTLDSDFSTEVKANEPYIFVLSHSKFESQQVFNGTIDILPLDGRQNIPISVFAAFRAVVVAPSYQKLEIPNKQGKYIILGEHAYYANVDEEFFFKKPWIKKNDYHSIWVESYLGRRSYASKY